MQTILEFLSENFLSVLSELNYNVDNPLVVLSNREDLCDYQCNVSFKIGKQYNKGPLEIAYEILFMINQKDYMRKIAFYKVLKPGYINITLRTDFIIEMINYIKNTENYGYLKKDLNECILIDYGGPNIAKPLHVGHLRSAVIGESLKRMAKVRGYKVISDIHLGDWGLQIGLVICELLERFNNINSINISAELLNEIYPTASEKSKNNKVYKEKAKNITYELQHGNENYIKLWKKISNTSILELKKDYKKLNIDFDLWYGESDSNEYIDELLMILKNKGILSESEGAKVVILNNDYPPAIIIKSDGSVMYTTTDLATIIQREKDYSPNEIWYVVDNRQELHFRQVFDVARAASLVPDNTKLEFLNFGTMNGKDGKPYKTRDGGVMRLSNLIEQAIENVKNKIIESGHISLNSLDDTAQKIAIAAIKFGDLINYREKDYIFDLNKFISFEGKTGVYILYNIARINSILRKVNFNKADSEIKYIYSDYERKLFIQILNSLDVFKKAIEEKAPNLIAENIYKIANSYSAFYNNNIILKEDDLNKKENWLLLSTLVKDFLIFNLDLLGIECVDEM